MAVHEQLFLNRARQACEQSLAFADRLIHFMWANVILASYFLRAGRVVEAHSTIGSTVRFAVGAGLHVGEAMETMQTHDVNALSLPPADPIDGEERANLWWSLTMCEAAISLGAGLPSSAPVEVSSQRLYEQNVGQNATYLPESSFSEQLVLSAHVICRLRCIRVGCIFVYSPFVLSLADTTLRWNSEPALQSSFNPRGTSYRRLEVSLSVCDRASLTSVCPRPGYPSAAQSAITLSRPCRCTLHTGTDHAKFVRSTWTSP